MRLLLDTHVAQWAVDRPERLPERVRGRLASPENEIFVSVVSLWEIAIKHALCGDRADGIGFSMDPTLGSFLEAGCEVPPVTAAHIRTLETLANLHRDPSDRLLAAQALTEPLRLVTHDPDVAASNEKFVRF